MQSFRHYCRQWVGQFERLLARKYVKPAIIGLAGFLIGVLLAEFGLNFWIRSALRASLIDTGAKSQLKADLSWLSLPDLARGRIRYARLNATHCRISELNLARLDLVNEGFRFDLPLLLRGGGLRFLEVRKTAVEAWVSDQALSEYLRTHYPDYQLDLNVLADRVRLTGVASVFGNEVPILLEGEVAPVDYRNIRFFPKRLLISGRSMGSSFVGLIGDQIPLEFPLLPNLPLRLTGLRLKPGQVRLSWRESPILAGTGEDSPNY